MKKSIIILFLIIFWYTLPSQCVTWYNGTSSNTSINIAVSYLCGQKAIDSVQNATSVYTNPIKKKELAELLFRSLFPKDSAKSDYFPVPFIDVDASVLNYRELIASKAMHYLDYNDGIPPFSRDYFFTNQNIGFVKRGDALRAILEAWNITPNWTGYDHNSSASSNFYSDISNNDPNFGWIQKAHDLGITDTLPLNGSCTISCLNNSVQFTMAQVYVILHRLWVLNARPTIDSSHFYIPNNFSVNNISNKAGLDRAVFENYEDPSYHISGGGLPLSFGHSYHSDLTELPFMPDDNTSQFSDAYIQTLFPLGIGWMHSFSSKIISIKNFVSNTFVEQKFAIRWADGSVDIYDKNSDAYITPAVKDKLFILSSQNGKATRIKIYKRDGTNYLFSADTVLGIFQLDTIRDRYDNALIFTYTNGASVGGYVPKKLVSVLDNYSNRSLIFNYKSGTNFIESVTDPLNRIVRFYVNANSKDLDSFVDAKTQTSKYLYSSGVYKHLLTKVRRPKGNFIDNTYAKRKLQSSQTSAYTVNISFTTSYLQSSSTTHSQVSVTQNGNTLKTNYVHNERGNPTHVKSETQNTKISYDIIHPDYPSVILDSHTMSSSQFGYDINGNTATSSVIAKNQAINTSTTYTIFDLPETHADENGKVSRNIYDALGNLRFQIGAENDTTQLISNTKGLLQTKIDPIGITSDFFYNKFGNLDSSRLRGTNISARAYYDDISRIIKIRNINHKFSKYGYDNNDNLIYENFDSVDLNETTTREFDANDNQIRIIDPKTLPTNLIYDSVTDDLLFEVYGRYRRGWMYNEDGTLKSYTNKKGTVFNYLYYPSTNGAAGLVKSDGYARFTYKDTTKLTDTVQRIGTNKVIKYGYDIYQRTSSITYSDFPNNKVSYEYYNNGNLRYITYPFNPQWKIEYIWDGNNRLKRVRDWKGNTLVEYIYRKNGQIDYEVYLNGTSNHYHYDAVGRLDSIYSLNSAGQLICANGSVLDDAGYHISESHYIDQSDTTGKKFYPLEIPSGYTYDSMNRLTGTNKGQYISDSNGNFISDPYGNSYSWDERDNLLSNTQDTTTKLSEYDPQENRRRYDSTRFALDILGRDNVLVEMNLNGTPKALYIHGLGLICRINISDSSRSFYHYDFRGSTSAITNDTQKIISYYTYSDFGAILSAKLPSFKNWFAYVGKYGVMADDSDRYYMRARHYIPSLGRFIGEDPVWSTNLFPYGENNPISNIDPNGEFVETALDVISLIDDANSFRTNPTIGSGLLLAYSAVSTLVPGMPGSYALKATKYLFQAKAIKMFSKVGRKVEKVSGSYLLEFQSSKFYAGKGLEKRMEQSINRIEKDYGDKILKKTFYPAKNSRSAFINEHKLMMKNGGPLSFNPNSPTYNKVFSPGRKYKR